MPNKTGEQHPITLTKEIFYHAAPLMPRLLATVTLLWCLYLNTDPMARADEMPTPPIRPTATRILLLPTLDQTGDRPEMQRQHSNTSDHRLAYEFLIRGFQVYAPQVGVRAAHLADVDLNEEQELNRHNLQRMGQIANVDWVVAPVVVEVHEIGHPVLELLTRRAQAKVQLRVCDVRTGQYLTDRFYQDTKTTTRAMPGLLGIGTTGLFHDAIDTTVQRSVSNLLHLYPIVRNVPNEWAETGLLEGENSTSLARSAYQGVTLAAGTPITVALRDQIQSNGARDGDPVLYEVATPVLSSDASHQVILAQGAMAVGHVIVGDRRGYVGRPGHLEFTCDYAIASNGQRIDLRNAEIGQRGQSNEVGAILGDVLIGPLALLINGRDVAYQPGQTFKIYADHDMQFSPSPASNAVPTAATESIAVVSPIALPAAPTPAPAVVAQAPTALAPVPEAPAKPKIPFGITAFPQRVRFEMTSGNSYFGTVTDYDGTFFTITTKAATLSIKASDLRGVELLEPLP